MSASVAASRMAPARSAVELDPLDLDVGRRRHRDMGGDQVDVGAAECGGAGECPAHQARDRFPMKRTGSRCSRVPPALTATRRPVRSRLAARPAILGSARIERRPRTARGLRQPAGTQIGTGEPARVRVDHHGTALAQGGHVGLGRRVQPHLGVHGRREQNRRPRGEQHVGQQVVGPAGGGSGEQVRGRGGDDHQVGLLAELDMWHQVRVFEHPVCTGRPDSAAQVAVPTNSSAAAVGTTVTSCPSAWNRRSSRRPCTRRSRRSPRG